MSLKFTYLNIVALFPSLAFAASGAGHGDPHAIPWVMIGQQVLNFAIAIFIIGYFAGGSISRYFKQRREEFLHLLKQAEEAKISAEQKKTEISEKLTKLTATKEQVLSNAKAEAIAMKTRMLQEAEDFATKLKVDAQRTSVFEAERAKAKIRAELLEKSINASKTELPRIVDGARTIALNNQFIEKLQVNQ